MDLSVAMIQAKHELKEKIKEIRKAIPLPPYVISSILSEIQNELKDEDKELLTIMLLQAKEEGDNAEDNILHNDREPSEE